jgi:8-oxo-dGTP pyrophosphatase MutT (NUDIX family)
LVDPWFSKEQAIAKEILEETWYTAKNIYFLLKWPKSPWMTNEFSYDYYVQVSWNRWEQSLEESEEWLKIIEIRNTIKELLKLCNKKEKEWVLISPWIWASVWKALTLWKIKLD